MVKLTLQILRNAIFLSASILSAAPMGSISGICRLGLKKKWGKSLIHPNVCNLWLKQKE